MDIPIRLLNNNIRQSPIEELRPLYHYTDIHYYRSIENLVIHFFYISCVVRSFVQLSSGLPGTEYFRTVDLHVTKN